MYSQKRQEVIIGVSVRIAVEGRSSVTKMIGGRNVRSSRASELLLLQASLRGPLLISHLGYCYKQTCRWSSIFDGYMSGYWLHVTGRPVHVWIGQATLIAWLVCPAEKCWLHPNKKFRGDIGNMCFQNPVLHRTLLYLNWVRVSLHSPFIITSFKVP